MRGDLESSSFVDLCRGLAEASSTGTVALEGPEGTGNVIFRRGRVVWAQSPAPRARLGDRLVNAALLNQEELDQALELQARSEESTKLGALLVEQGLVTRDVIRVFVQEQILDAAFDLMRWREGTFEFTPGEAVDEKLPVDIPVDQLLVEVSRRQSEWDEIERAIPDLDLVPDFRTGGSSAAASLEPDEFAVLANVDGHRSIRDLADHLGYSEFEAARIVYGLVLLGVVRVGAEPEEEAGGEVEAEFDLRGADEPSGVPAEDEVDVGRALEDALSWESEEPPPRPPVRVHIDDEGRFPITPTDEDEEDDEPEPWEPSDDLSYFADPPVAPQEGEGEGPEEETEAPSRADLPDEEFASLIDELAGEPDEAERTDAQEDGDEAEEPADDAGRVPPGEQGPSPEPDEGVGSDVSEFLRELSRLAVDDNDQGPATPRRERDTGGQQQERPPTRPERQEETEEDKKRKGFFGWGR